MSQQPKPEFLKDVSKQHELKHTEPPQESVATTQAKVLLGVMGEQPKKRLSHVDPPKEGLSEAQKEAYLEEKKAQEKK